MTKSSEFKPYLQRAEEYIKTFPENVTTSLKSKVEVLLPEEHLKEYQGFAIVYSSFGGSVAENGQRT